MKVVIPCAGMGSRLMPYTRHFNKAMLRIGDYAAITHIIENYPRETEYVILLGYKGRQLQEYLKMLHPDVNIRCVYVDKYKEEDVGSSLLYSLSKARAFLQEPFIFHVCDALLTGEYDSSCFDNVDGDVILVATKHEPSELYEKISWDRNSGVIDFLGRTEKEIDSNNEILTYIGISYIRDYVKFWKTHEQCLSAGCVNDVEIYKDPNILVNVFQGEKLGWIDIGNVDGLKDARSQYKSSADILYKSTEDLYFYNGKVLKYFDSMKILQEKVSRTFDETLSKVIPLIEKVGQFSYLYSYVPGEVLSKSINPDKIRSFCYWAENFLWKDLDVQEEIVRDLTYKFYIEKTLLRAKMYLGDQEDSSAYINELLVPDIYTIIEELNTCRWLYEVIPSTYHGDLVVDNIIDIGSMFVLIDWREYMDRDNPNIGDRYYDLAKFCHSLYMNNFMLNGKKFQIHESEMVQREESNTIKCYDMTVPVTLLAHESRELFLTMCEAKGYSLNKIKVLTGIIWINMSPLHSKEIGDFLFLYGKYTVWKTLLEHSIVSKT